MRCLFIESSENKTTWIFFALTSTHWLQSNTWKYFLFFFRIHNKTCGYYWFPRFRSFYLSENFLIFDKSFIVENLQATCAMYTKKTTELQKVVGRKNNINFIILVCLSILSHGYYLSNCPANVCPLSLTGFHLITRVLTGRRDRIFTCTRSKYTRLINEQQR